MFNCMNLLGLAQLAVVLGVLVLGVESSDGSPHQWNRHVISGRHFDTLVTLPESPSIVQVPTVLVMYDNRCSKAVKDPAMAADKLPGEQYLLFVFHHVSVAEVSTWFEWDEDDDLKARYGMHDCPEGLFLTKGSQMDYQIPWIPTESFQGFVWRLMLLDVKIVNEFDFSIHIKISGNGPRNISETLQEGKTVVLRTYLSYFVVVKRLDTAQFLFGQVLKEKLGLKKETVITLNPTSAETFVKTNVRKWEYHTRKQEEAEGERIHAWRREVARMYFLQLKQPLLVPKLSRSRGFHLETLDSDLQRDIMEFILFKSAELSSNDNKVDLEPEVNTNQVIALSIGVSTNTDLAKKLDTFLKPAIEKWIKFPVQLNSVQIFKYFGGCVIRSHLSRVDNETISVIIDTSKGKDGQDSKWTLSYIGFDRYRSELDLTSNDVFIHESTLVVGRVAPLAEKSAVILQASYVLGEAWTWKYTKTQLTNGVIKENMFALVTENTKRGQFETVRDLWDGTKHKHDEL